MDAEVIFAEAFKAFHDTLPDDQKQLLGSYPNSQSMIEGIKTEIEKHPIHRTRLTACMKRLSAFAERIQPFFDIINIFIQSHPEYSALLWGAMRLLFFLGSNYVTFLEKLSDMFSRLVLIIPAYETYAAKLKDQYQKGTISEQPRLMQALSYLFSDLIGFCGDACRLLSPKKDIGSQVKFASRLCWQPFDSRFEIVVSRIEKHLKYFKLEMSVSHMTISLEQYSKNGQGLEEVIERQQELREVVGNLIKQHNIYEQDFKGRQQELKESTKELIERHARYERELKMLTEMLIERDEEKLKIAEETQLRNTFAKLKKSIAVEQKSDIFGRTIRRQLSGSGQWLFHNSAYRTWFERSSTNSGVNNILMVLGKPGYGKTHLCANVIDNLRKLSQPPSHQVRPKVFFHFFDRLQRDTCCPQLAFRSILSQMLEFHHNDKDAIDIVSLAIYRDHGNGWSYISQEEILCAVALLLEKNNGYFLVFDGVDECEDILNFFTSLNSITSFSHRCNIAIFSRPDIRVPKPILTRTTRLFLNSTHNTGDIFTLIIRPVQELADEQILPSEQDPVALATEISTRANGMFLWARLLVEYLQCDALSMQERVDALNGMVLLEGLDNLYGAILEKIYRKPKKARANVTRAFQWTVGALRELTPSELSIAATTIPGKPMADHDEIPNFEQNIGGFSGALLEISEEGTVRFVHLSVKEYLQKLAKNQAATESTNEFGVDETLMRLCLARTCVTYLGERLPTGPLSGLSQVTPSKLLIAQKYVFLDYCVHLWQDQICALLHYAESEPKLLSQERLEHMFRDLILELINFIQDRRRVTTWIEASWLFGVIPQASTLASVARSFCARLGLSTDQRQMFQDLASTLQDLASELDKISSEWESVLSTTPNEIWEPSISAFTHTRFLTENRDGVVKRLTRLNRSTHVSILLQSQSSDDGLEVGVVKLLVPRSILKKLVIGSLNIASIGWSLAYELWSAEEATLKFSVRIELPTEDISLLLVKAMLHKMNDLLLEAVVFSIPVTISPSLRRLIVSSSLIVIADIENSKSNVKTVWHQPLDLWYPCTSTETLCSHRHLSPDLLRLVPPHCILHDNSFGKNAYEFGCLFNRDETSLVLLRPAANYQGIRIHSYLGDLLEDFDQSLEITVLWREPQGSIFKALKTIPVQYDLIFKRLVKSEGVSSAGNLSKLCKFIHFHPSRPILIWGQDNGMIAWQYLEQDALPVQLYDCILENLTFSPCGRHVLGRIYGSPHLSATIDLFVALGLTARGRVTDLADSRQDPEFFPSNPLRYSLEPRESLGNQILSNRDDTTGDHRGILNKFAFDTPPKIQKDSNVVFYRTDGRGIEVSLLRQIQDGDAIVLHTLGDDGTVRSEALSRLPESMRSAEAVLLPQTNQDDADTVRLVLHKRPQNTYCLGQRRHEELPAIIQRTRKSIPRIVGQNKMLRGLLGTDDHSGSSEGGDGRPTKRIKF